MAKDTLTITDNRTGKSYELPIENGTIKALDLRQIKAGADDFGLMTYDPALHQHRGLQEPDHLHRRRQGHPQLPRLPDRAAGGEEHVPGDRLPHPERRAADQGASTTRGSYNITHHTMVHENIKELMNGFRYDAHPMGMLMSTVAALSTFYPEAKDIHDAGRSAASRSSGSSPRCRPWPPSPTATPMGMPFVYPGQRPELLPATSCR